MLSKAFTGNVIHSRFVLLAIMKQELQVIKFLLPWQQLQSGHLQPVCPISTTQTLNQQPHLGVKVLLVGATYLVSGRGTKSFHTSAVNE